MSTGALHIVIAAVGKAKPGPERDLYESYRARLPWRVDLKEIEIKKELAVAARKAREGEALLAAVPAGARMVALDERGRTETSDAFASRLGRWRDDGVRTVAFVIGGADGLDETVRRKADFVLSFGALTWPHMLVRAMLAEQVYRAQSILAGHPYHRA
ncbi:MAG: 23S rRNA (pseudouridine(1915)-N(3))-methyltransferase RlmH [Rhodospirillaceae bacterium]